ncbi:ABC transporter ATP-binding protein [Listeria welshimeri]|uniref:ABC transporter, ATP-binding protein n=1 Tax=Listeria welshimeri serovar 6b (strain ATCC 35897 / DSM 20650 / CCUG 15529 / CIP 8149 / NCTC 11857 / SLCC 5334 / V8) TaxID=386043 RepID=A0AFJ4_LISW6|nr:ABC transporter ATP-binding protein [Listeria welshimeri]MBC1253276.1 ABC transporter ATP-binding protein [Listeria welshimeri]MBC1282694.1 ABC transporter ATP-binding protein [Listeria welshimeri]MBC1355968.1 ABC transporter ATP-binding protein [Listeria welshimeri]MBC1432134.1 ABC transporter ATP-binding protein [Listeria welshimeri]MBC1452135.1 ABC transporter ATP-binding protein [Listeria welshimeri]
MIQLFNISKTYQMGEDTIKALDNLSLQVTKGEFIAIIGPSGSGKSTLMNIIGILDRASSGEYYLNKMNLMRISDKKISKIRNKKIGFIFQQFNLMPRLTAFENVELPLIYRGTSKPTRKKIVLKSLERVGLLEKQKHLPAQLSGGQQQRVAIARAIAGNPEIILADEPTGALDSKTGEEVMRLLKEIHREGNTLIMITHDKTIAEQAERIIEIKDGKLREWNNL